MPILCLLTVWAVGCAGGKPKVRVPKPGPATRVEAPIGHQVAGEALEHLGTPYRYGGSSPRGFDCSGLTFYVYKKFGVKLPRRAKDQLKAGTRVSRRELQPGDLVFFKTRYYRGFHVGIYIGHGKFVHAPHSGKRVERRRLDKGYYRRAFYAARRITS